MIDVSQYAVNLMGWLFKRHLDKVYCVNLKSVNSKIISGLFVVWSLIAQLLLVKCWSHIKVYMVFGFTQ